MADMEVQGRGGSTYVEERGVGARAMMEDSLPPRKRLLAGLKQNGLWPAASIPAGPSSASAAHQGRGAVDNGVSSETRSPMSAAVTEEATGGCVGCGALQSSPWRRVKRSGVVHRLCNFCAMSFNKGLNCPHCLVVYPDVMDPTLWLKCQGCQRFVHVECEQRYHMQRYHSQLIAHPYICSDCVRVGKDKEGMRSLFRSGGTDCIGSLGVSFGRELGNFASSGAFECSSPCRKRARGSKEFRSNCTDEEVSDACQTKAVGGDSKCMLETKFATSQEATAAAAATAAVLAVRTAAAAKASAAAKAALDAAAFAARVEAQGRFGSRRRATSCEVDVDRSIKVDASYSQARKISTGKPIAKLEGQTAGATNLSSMADEELARQLHRAINSSPRISSGLTPQRRKPSARSGAIINTSHSVISWSKVGLSSAGEPRSKQQQSRPRSIYQKEGKHIHYRAERLSLKASGAKNSDKFMQYSACSVASGDLRPLGYHETESPDETMLTMVNEGSDASLLQSPANACLKTVTYVENEGADEEALHDLPTIESNLKRKLVVANDCRAGSLLGEVALSGSDVAANEEGLIGSEGLSSVPGDHDAAAAMNEGVAFASNPRLGKEEPPNCEHEVCNKMHVYLPSGEAALAEPASCAMEALKDESL